MAITHWHEWVNRLAFASLEWVFAVFVCQIVAGVIAIRNRQSAMGIVLVATAILCFPGLLIGVPLGLVYGWTKARRWQIRTFMIFWTAIVIIATLNVVAYLMVRVGFQEAGPYQFPY